MFRKKLYIKVAAVLIVGTVVAYELWPENEIDDTINSREIATECDSGTLIDTHLHLEDDSVKENITDRMNENNVGCSVAFVYMNPNDPSDSAEILNEEIGENLGQFVLFFYIDPKKATDVSSENVQKVLNYDSQSFSGFGEVALYRPPFLQSSLLDSHWQDTFGLAAEKKIFMMIHLRGKQQVPELEQTLQKFPTLKVLIHGPEMPEEMPRLLKKYPNLYFTLDTASLLVEKGTQQPDKILMYTEGGKSALTEALKNRRSKILTDTYERWFPVIESAPDKVMWGTDVSMEWHADEDIYSELVRFTEDFIKMLPEDMQDGYAKGNALRLFAR